VKVIPAGGRLKFYYQRYSVNMTELCARGND